MSIFKMHILSFKFKEIIINILVSIIQEPLVGL